MKTAIRLYRSSKFNLLNVELIEYNDVVNTFLLLMKRLRFCCSENYFFLVVHPDILCIVYAVAQLCGCRIVHLDLVAKSLLLSVSLNDCYYELLFIHSLTTTIIFFSWSVLMIFSTFISINSFFWDFLYDSHVDRRSDCRKIFH